jgi:cytidylate kinase
VSGVILVGPAGAGKDTVAAWIAQDFSADCLGLADPLRTFVAGLLGPGKHRAALQAIGEALRAENPLVLVQAAQRRVAGRPRWVITDARLPQELAGFPGALTVAISAPLALRITRLRLRDGAAPHGLQHPTEAVDDAIAHCQIHLANSGSLDALHDAYADRVVPALVAHWSAPCATPLRSRVQLLGR